MLCHSVTHKFKYKSDFTASTCAQQTKPSQTGIYFFSAFNLQLGTASALNTKFHLTTKAQSSNDCCSHGVIWESQPEAKPHANKPQNSMIAPNAKQMQIKKIKTRPTSFQSQLSTDI